MVKGKRFFKKCYIVAVGSEKGWSPSLISKRINSNGGHHQRTITKDTTHVIATAKAWKKQGALIKEALAINDDIDNKRKTKHKKKIHIVSFTWLDDSFLSEKVKGEQPFKWEFIQPKAMQNGEDADDEDSTEEEDDDNEPAKVQKKPNGKTHAKVDGKTAAKKAQEMEEQEPKSHKGMMAQVFEESTNQYVNAKEAAAIKKKQENERRIAEELAEEERKEKEAKKAAAAFKKGAKKCRNEIFSGEYSARPLQ